MSTIERPSESYSISIFLSICALGLCVWWLWSVPSPTRLPYAYFLYFGASVAFFHAVFFYLSESLRLKKSRHRARLPRYVEYLYIVILSTGLFQIYFAGPQAAEYLKFRSGGEQVLLDNVRQEASLMNAKCAKQDEVFLTSDYCSKIKRIAASQDLKKYLLDDVARDADFLRHVVARVHKVTKNGEGDNDLPWPGVTYIQQLSDLERFFEPPYGDSIAKLFSWMGLLLLPIGISLRFVKTSLELAG